MKLLFYPDTIKDYHEKETETTITDELADGTDVNIRSYQLPIINRTLLEQAKAEEIELSELFDETKTKLAERIKEILKLQLIHFLT